MFEIFSWNEYLFGLLIAAAGYYLFVVVIFYRKEVLNPSRLGKKQPYQSEKAIKPFNKQPEFLGKAQPDIFPTSEHVSLENSEQLVIAESKPKSNDPDTAANGALLLGTIADLLQEFKTLIQVIAESKPGKGQTIVMVQSLLSRYSHLSETKFRSPINLYLIDLLKEDLSMEMTFNEINQLWNEHKKS